MENIPNKEGNSNPPIIKINNRNIVINNFISINEHNNNIIITQNTGNKIITVENLDIKIDLFFVSFVMNYTVNAFFFNDDTMHKIYEDKEMNF